MAYTINIKHCFIVKKELAHPYYSRKSCWVVSPFSSLWLTSPWGYFISSNTSWASKRLHEINRHSTIQKFYDLEISEFALQHHLWQIFQICFGLLRLVYTYQVTNIWSGNWCLITLKGFKGERWLCLKRLDRWWRWEYCPKGGRGAAGAAHELCQG